MPQTPAWRAPEGLLPSSDTLVPPPQPQTMAPARAPAALSICSPTGACSRRAPQPKSLLTSMSQKPKLVALLALLGSGLLFPRSPGFGLWARPTSLASCSLLSAFLFNKKPKTTANMRTKTNGSRTFVNRVNIHNYVNDSTAKHSYVAVFLLTLVII